MRTRNHPPPRPFSRRDLQLEVSWFFTCCAVTFLIAALLAGCGGAAPEPTVAFERVDHLTLSPAPELLEETTEWAARWSAASGIPVTVGAGGVPVAFADPSEFELGSTECGSAKMTFPTKAGAARWHVVSISINAVPDEYCPSTGYAIGHELAHALGGPLATHTTYGYAEVFAARLGPDERYRIGEATLDSVCGSGACTVYAPEP